MSQGNSCVVRISVIRRQSASASSRWISVYQSKRFTGGVSRAVVYRLRGLFQSPAAHQPFFIPLKNLYEPAQNVKKATDGVRVVADAISDHQASHRAGRPGLEVLDQRDQHFFARLAHPRVTQQHGDLRIEAQGVADLLRLVYGGPVEAVHRDHKRDTAPFEEVHRGKTRLQPP